MKRRFQRLDLDGSLKGCDGLLEISRLPREFGKIGVKFGDLGVHADGVRRTLDRDRGLALLPGEHGEKKKRARMARLLLEDLLADAFSLDESAGALVFLERSKRVLDWNSFHQSLTLRDAA
jgi:hypothetical protein